MRQHPSRRALRGVALAIAVACGPRVVLAAEQTFSIEHGGYLLNGADAPVTLTQAPFAFRLYSHETSTSAVVWPASGPATCLLDVRAGYYKASLGGDCGAPLTEADMPPGDPRWLEITANGVTLAPRLRVVGAPTAVRARRAESADYLGTLAPTDVWAKTSDLATALVSGQTLSTRLGALAPATGSANYVQNLAATAAAQSGAFHVSGDSKVDGAFSSATLSTTGNTSVGGNLSVSGAITGGGFTSGVLGLANGGFGTSAAAFPAGSLAAVAAGGGSFGSIAPGAAGTLLGSDGSAWASRTAYDLALGRRTTASLQLYVRTDGDDTSCNGSANVAFSAGIAPACAVKTIQRAVNLVPEIIEHAVTIDVAAGTYYATSAGQVLVSVRKLVTVGNLLIRGVGSVTVSGALSTAPTVATALHGFLVSSPTDAVTIQNFTIERFTASAVTASSSTVSLVGITGQNTQGNAFQCTRAACAISGTSTFSNNTSQGVYASFGGFITVSGTFVANNNGYAGVAADQHANIAFLSGSTAQMNSNSSFGLAVGYGARVSGSGTMTFANNGGTQIFVSSNGTYDGAGNTTITVGGNDKNGIYASNGAYIGFGSGNVTISCPGGSTGTTAVWAEHNSVILLYNSANSFAISSCRQGLFAQWGSQILDNGSTALHTMTGATTNFGATVNSAILRGGFAPAAGTPACTASTYGQCL